MTTEARERLFWLQGAVGLFLLFCLIFLLLAAPKETQRGVAEGVGLCLQTLIPSMLPLLVLGAFFQLSEPGAAAARLLEPAARRLFGVPGAGAGVLLFAALGGFPAGAEAISAALRQKALTLRDGRVLQLLAFVPSAAFTVGAVGGGLLGSGRIGLLLELSVLLPVLPLSVGLRLLSPPTVALTPTKQTALPAAEAFVTAVERGARAMLRICAFVCLFSALPPLLSRLPVEQNAQVWILSLTELTMGVRRAAVTLPLPAVAGLLSFGGFCTHCQILPTLHELRLKYWRFFLFRLCHAALSAVVCFVLCRLFPIQAAVFARQGARFAPSSASSVTVSVCLCCMCVLLLAGGDTVLKCRT